VIHYDQIGNGRSAHLRDRGADFWTVAFFHDELDRLLKHHGIARRYDTLGQSSGGMLAAEHAALQAAGLRRLVVANLPASMKTCAEEANRLRGILPEHVQCTLTQHEEAGTIQERRVSDRGWRVLRKHVRRVVPTPPEVVQTFAAIAEDPTVYHTMNDPTEFHVVDLMRGWTIESRLRDHRADAAHLRPLR
jgi:L-proline amide hydrolase